MQTSNQTKKFLDLFNREAVPAMAVETERAAIRAAQAGDKNAALLLVSTYMPAIKTVVGQYLREGKVRTNNEVGDEVRSAAIVGALSAIDQFDLDGPAQRLAAILPEQVRLEVYGLIVDETLVTVPARTLRRYHAIMRKADQDIYRAIRIAPEHEMSADTLLAVHEAVRNVDSIDAQTDNSDDDEPTFVGGSEPKWDSGFADAEDRILVEAAMAALTDMEKEIILMAYGFIERPLPDAEIANLMVLSRQKVQRLRAGALIKMRDRLGAL